MAKHWPDETTRELLASLVQNYPGTLAWQMATSALAEHWPKEGQAAAGPEMAG